MQVMCHFGNLGSRGETPDTTWPERTLCERRIGSYGGLVSLELLVKSR